VEGASQNEAARVWRRGGETARSSAVSKWKTTSMKAGGPVKGSSGWQRPGKVLETSMGGGRSVEER
jgi:hypothetical protein